MTELEYAWKNARSFTVKDRPTDLKYIGKVSKSFERGIREFLFFKDASNQTWYESRWKDKK